MVACSAMKKEHDWGSDTMCGFGDVAVLAGQADLLAEHVVPRYRTRGRADNATPDPIEPRACRVDSAIRGEMATDRVVPAADVAFTAVIAANSTLGPYTRGA